MTGTVEVLAYGTLSSPDAGGRRDVTLIPMRSSALAVGVLTLGAALHTVEAPDRSDHLDHVALHLPDLADHQDRDRNPYLGATCGRFANRISDATYELDGQRVRLVANEGRNQLHGGPDGFDRRIWDLIEATPTADGGRILLGLTSQHGDQGYPGTLEATVAYELHGRALRITYEATTDAPTVVNLCNHAYWNLGGSHSWSTWRSVADHELRVVADRVLPTDAASLPDGPLAPVDGSPFDFRARRPLDTVLDERPEGIDHSFEVTAPPESRPDETGGLHLAAELHHPASGRTLLVSTDQPAMQVYTANGLGDPFAPQAAICLEAQRFPDAPNRADLGSAVLRHGEHYRATTELTFGVM